MIGSFLLLFFNYYDFNYFISEIQINGALLLILLSYKEYQFKGKKNRLLVYLLRYYGIDYLLNNFRHKTNY
jgi:hypothetical protein